MNIMNIKQLKKLIKDLPDGMKVQLTNSDLDFLKDVMSELLSNGEAISDHLKNEGKFYKESDPFHSHLCYKDFTKIRAKIKKLAEVQRKIKRMR